MKPRLIRASYFVWIVVPLALYAVYQAYGLPHFIWSYDWRDDGQGYDPFANRYYLRCTYIGPYGAFTEHFPKNGECDWFQFHKDTGGDR